MDEIELISIMLMQGVNVKVAQEHLGHKDISTTLNIYAEVRDFRIAEANNLLASEYSKNR